MTKNNMRHIVNYLMEDGSPDVAVKLALMENEQDELLTKLGGSNTILRYLYRFQQYWEDHDLYLFDGWKEAKILAPISVEKFWVTITVVVPKGTELDGAKRLMTDKEAQNNVQYRKLDSGAYIVRFKILKRYLDEIDIDNEQRVDRISDDKLDK